MINNLPEYVKLNNTYNPAHYPANKKISAEEWNALWLSVMYQGNHQEDILASILNTTIPENINNINNLINITDNHTSLLAGLRSNVNSNTSRIGSLESFTIDLEEAINNLDNIVANYDERIDLKVDKVEGKGLSTEDYTTTEKDKLAGIAGEAQVNIIEEIKVNNTALTPTAKSVNITIPVQASDIGALPDTIKYGATIDLSYTANTGVLGLVLKDQDGTQLSSNTVDLPLELLIESGSVKTCTVIDTPVVGYVIGDKYIDLVLANSNHIYIKVSDLIDQVTITETGTGNAVTDISISGNTITETKGKTFVETSRTVNGHALSSDVTVTKSDVELGNCDNTSDANKPVSTAQAAAIALKVDKVEGKGLSTEDYTTTEKDKLAGIASGAQVNVQSDWNATSGDALILNKPTIPESLVVKDNLTSTSVVNSLSANQGRVLNVNKVDKVYSDEWAYTSGLVFTWDTDHYIIGDGTVTHGNGYPTGSETDIIIPKYYDDGTHGIALVTKIGQYAFYDKSFISVKLPETIEEIGALAFWSCNAMREINLPNNINTIGGQAFSNCYNLRGFTTLPNKLTILSRSLFNECFYLGNNIDIPYGVTTIENSVFSYVNYLENITIPASVTTLGNNIFSFCSSLRGVTFLGLTPPTIGNSNFTGSSSRIYVPYESLTAYKTATGWSTYASRIYPIPNGKDLTDRLDLKLDITEAYTLPTASTTVLGGVKVDGTTITVSEGVISSTASGSGTVTSVGISNSTNGGLSVSDSPITSLGTISVGHTNILAAAQTTQALYPIKIDKNGHISEYGTAVTIPDGVVVVDNLTSTSTTSALSANQGKVLNDNKVPNTRTVAGKSLSSDITLASTDLTDTSNIPKLDTAQTFTAINTFNAPTNIALTEQATTKFMTANGGSLTIGKEGPNSGTMLKFCQVDGTPRLLFRSSATVGAVVWSQPEQGAQLYIDLGLAGSDYHRIAMPSSAGTLALTSQLDSAIANMATTQSYTATLSSSGWTGSSAPYSKEITVSGILATDKLDFDLNLSSSTYANIPTIQSAWFNVYRAVSGEDKITFYSHEIPSIDIPLLIKVVR